MHRSSYDSMKKCFDTYVVSNLIKKIKVVDIGSLDVSKDEKDSSYAPIFKHDNIVYTGVDIIAGKNVDVVLENFYKYPFRTNSIDVVISGQTLEHITQFWRSLTEMARVLKKGGYLFLIVPSKGNYHAYPLDCYRFHVDSMKAFAEWTRLELIDRWWNKHSRWGDVIGVFKK